MRLIEPARTHTHGVEILSTLVVAKDRVKKERKINNPGEKLCETVNVKGHDL